MIQSTEEKTIIRCLELFGEDIRIDNEMVYTINHVK